MAKRRDALRTWVDSFLRDTPLRSKSLIVTIFGDLIAPHIQGVWLSELTALLAPFEVNGQLVRTSSFRLMEEGWLQSERVGRRSRYALTASGLQRVEHAYHRIYQAPPTEWDGSWTLVVLNKVGNAAFDRVELRRQLGWEGFGLLGPGILLHPCANLTDLRQILDRLSLTRSVSVFSALSVDAVSFCPVETLITECWNLDSVASLYTNFLTQFREVVLLLKKDIDPEIAYLVQTLLIHSFRRIVLHDPRIPAVLLPAAWPGYRAYELSRNIYALTSTLAQDYLKSLLENGQSLQPSLTFSQRFTPLGL